MWNKSAWPSLVGFAGIPASLPGLIITPLTVEDITQAAKLMGEYNLDHEDAIHLATALRNRAKEIISNDEAFDKAPQKRKFS
ncbi:MAG: type II toxin-antitoxin system VapC family toxin [Candidatus Bathyarchaeia archaeon]